MLGEKERGESKVPPQLLTSNVSWLPGFLRLLEDRHSKTHPQHFGSTELVQPHPAIPANRLTIIR